MPIGSHCPTPPKPSKTQEGCKVGDSVQIYVKPKPGSPEAKGKKTDGKGGQELIEAAVVDKRGMSVRVMFENKIDYKWVDATELVNIIPDGAEELLSRAEKAAQAAAEAAAKKKAEDEAKAAEKAAAEAKAAAAKAEAKRIFDTYKARALKAFDWCPTGKYFNLDHLPIPDHQKDIFRIVAYVLDPEVSYKKPGHPRFPPDNAPCGARVYFTDGTATPMNFGVLKPEEEWTEQDHELKGGSKDKVVKGDGSAFLLQKQLAEDSESDPWACKVCEFKEAFDGGRTLKKYDYYPAEDPAEWIEIDNETMRGWVRKDEEGHWEW